MVKLEIWALKLDCLSLNPILPFISFICAPIPSFIKYTESSPWSYYKDQISEYTDSA